MSKARDKDQSIGMMVFGVLLLYAGIVEETGAPQIAFSLVGLALLVAGAYIFANASGMIQTGKAKSS